MDAPSTSGIVQSQGEKNSSKDADSTQALTRKGIKKRTSLTDYTYDVLFLQGERSDITIRALDKEWHLHKNLLCRSGYFSGMFSGAWQEANKSEIEMSVPDDITPETLHTAFGSLYKDDVEVSNESVTSVLKAACFLQIDALVEKCVAIIEKSLSVTTVSTYYSTATDLGLPELAKACIGFLELVLVTESQENQRILMENVSIDML